MENEEITLSIKLNEETKKLMELLEKIKSFDININFYKNMIASKSKFIN